ncbi:MAG: lipid II:glycine glycyltransferase FemX [Bacilli bacterium]
MKIVNLKYSEFEQFARNHPLRNYYQSVAYGTLMTNFGFKASYIGFVHNGNLIGASLILHRPIFMGFKYGYAPHGLLINYNDYKLLPEAVKKMKSYLFKQSFLILKIDPLIVKSIRDQDGNIINQNNELDKIMSCLKNTGFSHCGFNNYLEAVKPRWHAILDMRNEKATELFYDLEKQVRNKLRKAVKFGVEIYKDNTNNIEQIYEFIKNKGNYSLKYYQEFKNNFQDSFEIYLAKINTEVYVSNSKHLFEKESEVNDYLNNVIQEEGYKGKDMRTVLNKKMESDRILASYKKHLIISTQLLKDHPEGLLIGGAVVIKYGNQINLLIDGYTEEYNNLCPGYLTKWKIIEKYAQSEISFFDLNAISGDFTDTNRYKGLNEAKLGYNSLATEYIGEFNIIINKPMYALYRNTKDKYNLKEQKK